MFQPVYLDLPAGEIARRAEEAVVSLAECGLRLDERWNDRPLLRIVGTP